MTGVLRFLAHAAMCRPFDPPVFDLRGLCERCGCLDALDVGVCAGCREQESQRTPEDAS